MLLLAGNQGILASSLSAYNYRANKCAHCVARRLQLQLSTGAERRFNDRTRRMAMLSMRQSILRFPARGQPVWSKLLRLQGIH
jgi:hypothetical protein